MANTLRAVVGTALLILGTALAAYVALETWRPSGGEMNRETFEAQWTRDLAQLREKKLLPLGFESLKMIEFSTSDDQVRAWLEQFKPEFVMHTQGLYKLEVLIDTWADGQEKGVIIQYHLVDLASGDTIWELGRTLALIH